VTGRVVVVGAGIIGASCAYYLSRAGLQVTVLDRRAVAAGTTGAGEGNILLSDKTPGPELDLALRSVNLWAQLGEEIGEGRFELERKGGVVVARDEAALRALTILVAEQAAHGVGCELLPAERLREWEPQLADGLAGGAFYPGDLQVQPMLAAAQLLAAATALGATLRLGVTVTGLRTAAGRVTGVRLAPTEVVDADWVVNAAGSVGGQLSELFGVPIPVLPRRGFVLVTEPLPAMIRHKVYTADYVANVSSDDAGLETSSVIEGTASGPVLIGASRERVGFDRTLSVPVIRQLAQQAVELFPFLEKVNLMRVYRGFRPYSPDHLPVIGADPRLAGVVHACGHEGAGIGLAPGTGELVAALICGSAFAVKPEPFAPERLIGLVPHE
jgi:glycine/D-amino acid oxidase-like deaminating enzyme